jgi:PII-like signaling protein
MNDALAGASPANPVAARRLSVYLGESDRAGHQPLYEAIVLKAREMHIAGATVLRGPMGFGANSRIHTAKLLRLSEDLPIVIEIVDAPEKVEAIARVIEPMLTGGMMTVEDVRVLHSSAPRTR